MATETVPKRSLAGGEEGELLFCNTEEGVRRGLSGGKALLVSDGATFAPYAASPRAICVVYDDGLGLFSMPDGVSRVLAAGGQEVLAAARFFAEVRGVPCMLFPSRATLDGAFGPRGEVGIGGTIMTVPLRAGEVVCDEAVLRPTFAEAYARILLARLAVFEARALTALGVGRQAADAPGEPHSAEELLRAIAAMPQEGYLGEGRVLAERLGEDGGWNAYVLLTSLYAAFFEKGHPRRYFTPNYRARAAAAGRTPEPWEIPGPGEYSARAMRLERVRAQFAGESRAILSERERALAAYTRWKGAPPFWGLSRARLKELPELAPMGLSAIIRDFGLMDWNDDQGRTHQRN